MPHIWWGVLVAILGSVSLVLIFGSVTGTEFSPQTFQLQRYRFWRIPGLRLQVTPTVRDALTEPFAGDFTVQKWLAIDPQQPVEWHRLEDSVLGGTPECDPRILREYLGFDRYSTDKPRWQAWSHDHPELADVLWPLVSTAAQRKQYYVIPDIFRVAETSDSPDDLREKINKILDAERAGP